MRHAALHVDKNRFGLHDPPTNPDHELGREETGETRIGIDRGFFL
jgi:hypothetical protein